MEHLLFLFFYFEMSYDLCLLVLLNRVIINDDLKSGTMLPYIEKASEVSSLSQLYLIYCYFLNIPTALRKMTLQHFC